MKRRLTSGIVAAVCAISMSVPAVGLANAHGTPHKAAASCPAHPNKGKHKGTTKGKSKGKRKGSSKGRKCGKM
jgi:hypothetical protein